MRCLLGRITRSLRFSDPIGMFFLSGGVSVVSDTCYVNLYPLTHFLVPP